MPIATLTKLQGVNRILRACRQKPVSALSTTVDDALVAEQTLDEVLVREQMPGQHVNTTETALTVDGNDKIVLPTNTVKVEGSNQDACRNFFHKQVAGDLLLFDADEFPATSDFGSSGANTATVYVKITQALEFDELPPQHQFSIVDQAAVEYQEATLGDKTLGDKLEGRAGRSRAEARSYDIHSRPHNQLTDGASSIGRIGRIRNRPYGDRVERSQ